LNTFNNNNLIIIICQIIKYNSYECHSCFSDSRIYSHKERCYKLAAIPSVVCDTAGNKRSVILHADDVHFDAVQIKRTDGMPEQSSA